MAKPAKGKAKAKTVKNPKTGRKRTVSLVKLVKQKMVAHGYAPEPLKETLIALEVWHR